MGGWGGPPLLSVGLPLTSHNIQLKIYYESIINVTTLFNKLR